MELLDLFLLFLSSTVLSGVVAVGFGFFHEYLHIWKAKQLGCKLVKRFGNKLTIDTGHDMVKTRKIAVAPYVVIMPLNTLVLCFGVLLFGYSLYLSVGLIIGSIATFVIHLVSFPLEGKDE